MTTWYQRAVEYGLASLDLTLTDKGCEQTGRALRRLRQRARLSLSAVAERASTNRVTLLQAELGRRRYSWDWAVAIAQAIEPAITPENLLSESIHPWSFIRPTEET